MEPVNFASVEKKVLETRETLNKLDVLLEEIYEISAACTKAEKGDFSEVAGQETPQQQNFNFAQASEEQPNKAEGLQNSMNQLSHFANTLKDLKENASAAQENNEEN